MKTFTMYRHNDISATHDANQVNPPTEPQFEGVVFSGCEVNMITVDRKAIRFDNVQGNGVNVFWRDLIVGRGIRFFFRQLRSGILCLRDRR